MYNCTNLSYFTIVVPSVSCFFNPHMSTLGPSWSTRRPRWRLRSRRRCRQPLRPGTSANGCEMHLVYKRLSCGRGKAGVARGRSQMTSADFGPPSPCHKTHNPISFPFLSSESAPPPLTSDIICEWPPRRPTHVV